MRRRSRSRSSLPPGIGIVGGSDSVRSVRGLLRWCRGRFRWCRAGVRGGGGCFVVGDSVARQMFRFFALVGGVAAASVLLAVIGVVGLLMAAIGVVRIVAGRRSGVDS